MTATRSSDPKSLIPHRARGYGKERGRVVNRDAVTESAAFSEGALMSSVLDLARWDSSLYHPRVLTPASLDQMWTPVTLTDGKSYPYGFGWMVAPTNGLRTVGHGGSLPGFLTNFSRFVAKGLTVVVLGNAEWADPAALAQAIAGIYEPELAPKPPAAIDDPDPGFSAGIRALADGLGRGELDLSRLAPDARDEWSAGAVNEAAALLRRSGRIRQFELVERLDRGDLARRRYRMVMDRGALVLTVLTRGTDPLLSLTLEEALASR